MKRTNGLVEILPKVNRKKQRTAHFVPIEEARKRDAGEMIAIPKAQRTTKWIKVFDSKGGWRLVLRKPYFIVPEFK